MGDLSTDKIENNATKTGKASDTMYYSGVQAQEFQISRKKLKFAHVIITKPLFNLRQEQQICTRLQRSQLPYTLARVHTDIHNIFLMLHVSYAARNRKPKLNFYNSNKSPTRCNNFYSILLDVHLQLNMFQASPRPSSGVQQLQ
jgi:hypothetical protein